MSEIDDKYILLGGAAFFGQPLDIEKPTQNGLGRYRNYQQGSIYWHHAFPFEAFAVYGLIRQKWYQMGSEASTFGFPVTDELDAGPLGGRMTVFQGGAILYRPDVGTHEMHDDIFRRWREIPHAGGEGGLIALGFLLTDQLVTPDTRGRYNHFERGSMYWTPQTGAREVMADIKDAWAAGGWEQGSLGYPVSSPARMAGVLTEFQDFERGTIYAVGLNTKTLIRSGTTILATNQHFINWTDLTPTARKLPDADLITVTFSQNFSPGAGIHITLNMGPGVTWWKGLSLFRNGSDIPGTLMQGNSTTTIPASMFDSGDVFLHFGKAKDFGIHTGMYLLGRADRLLGTHAIFTWVKDR